MLSLAFLTLFFERRLFDTRVMTALTTLMVVATLFAQVRDKGVMTALTTLMVVAILFAQVSDTRVMTALTTLMVVALLFPQVRDTRVMTAFTTLMVVATSNALRSGKGKYYNFLLCRVKNIDTICKCVLLKEMLIYYALK